MSGVDALGHVTPVTCRWFKKFWWQHVSRDVRS